jgi:hypothetical protein
MVMPLAKSAARLVVKRDRPCALVALVAILRVIGAQVDENLISGRL